MSDDEQQKFHDAYIEFMKLLPEEKKELEHYKVLLESVNKQAVFFKDIYKKTNKISEFECAKKVKRIRELKIECDNEIKGLKKSIAATEDFIYLYEDIFGPQEVQINESPENLKDNAPNTEEKVETNSEKKVVKPTPEALAWVSKNTWYGMGGYHEETSFAYSTHFEVLKDGIIGDSDEYYNELNRRVIEAYPDLPVVEMSARKN